MTDDKPIAKQSPSNTEQTADVDTSDKVTPDNGAEVIKDESGAKDTKAPKKSAQQKQGPGISFFSGLFRLLSLLAIIAAGVLAYFGYQYYLQITDRLVSLERQEQATQLNTEQATENLRKQFAELQQQLQQNLLQQSADSGKKIESVSELLSLTRRQIQAFTGKHRSDWMLAEADYLVRIASNRLLLEGDHITAIALLNSADERIVAMDDPGLQQVREALAKDIAALKLLTRIDLAGIAIRINGLIPQVGTLPVISFQLPEEILDETEPQQPGVDQGWLENLKSSLGELTVKWFEVRDHGRPVSPLMEPEQELMLQNNMILLLQTVQFATLRQHESLYHDSLQKLRQRVVEYFDVSTPAVAAFIAELDSLNGLTIKETMPKTLESRLVLSREIEQRLLQTAPAPVNEGEQ